MLLMKLIEEIKRKWKGHEKKKKKEERKDTFSV